MSETYPREELTADQIRERHKDEADHLRWRLSINAGSVPGDLQVQILPWPIQLIDRNAVPKVYLYRRNPESTKYYLVKVD